jgi:hypothetical protein
MVTLTGRMGIAGTGELIANGNQRNGIGLCWWLDAPLAETQGATLVSAAHF